MSVRIKRMLVTMLAVMLAMVSVSAPNAYAAPRPTRVTLNRSRVTLNMDKTKSLKLSARVYPLTASQRVTWKSSNKNIATVSSKGQVRVKRTGRVTIFATARGTNKVAKCVINVVDAAKPSSITLSDNSVSMEVGDKVEIEATVKPSTASKKLTWKSSRSSVASVSSSGVIRARKVGSCTITVASAKDRSIKKTVRVQVVKKGTIRSLSITAPATRMSIGDKLTLKAVPQPSTASDSVTWRSSSTRYATVSSKGVVTAKRAGTVTITATSKKKSSVKAKIVLTILDPSMPTSIKLSSTELKMGEDDTTTLSATILPSTADKSVSWQSSNAGVVSVTSAGRITAKNPGTAVVTATTAKGNLKASCTVTVYDTTMTSRIPDRTTGISGISANMAKIEAIRRSAKSQINILVRAGEITSAEGEKRKDIIDRAFEMQAFPWMVEKKQDYWNLSLNYKAYLPGKVYYGLPYIQHSGGDYTNRRYNVAKALAEKRYVSSGKGYYLMNQDNLLRGKYVGNDCSSFVSQSQFGTKHVASYYSTRSIKSSNYYKAVSNKNSLRPGDLFVRAPNSGHTILFLYYIDASKTRAMVIEQGGNGNTVICSVTAPASYLSNGYVMRRQASFR